MAKTKNPASTPVFENIVVPVTESKKSKKASESVVVSTPVVEVSAPVVDAAPKTKKSKTSKKSTETSVDVSVPETATVSDEAVLASPEVVDGETPLHDQTVKFMDNLQKVSVLLSALKAEYRLLDKKWSRDLKAAQKQSSRRKRKTGNRAPSGFVKPTRISDELASFLGKEVGTEMARTAVTRDINVYIRTNNLQDPANGRKINPDDKLVALLKLQKTDELTYFNLQRFMSCHFSKNVKVEAPVDSA
jgi:chromatin remodeling complex protein RSC6